MCADTTTEWLSYSTTAFIFIFTEFGRFPYVLQFTDMLCSLGGKLILVQICQGLRIHLGQSTVSWELAKNNS